MLRIYLPVDTVVAGTGACVAGITVNEENTIAIQSE